jgi:leucyl/phenylalanyl-tRNA--protein transferase
LRPRTVEPPPNRWSFPPAHVADEHGLVCVGGDLEPGTILDAYRNGLFPMPVSRRHLGWWSPDPRAVIPLDSLRVTRSLRRSCRRYEVRVDTAFREVMEACGDPRRPHGWITKPFLDAYTRLHELGWVHSVETYTPDGELAGGLYGVAVGGLFAGESMFRRHTDASKVALVALVDLLRAGGMRLLDVQWQTPHLASLGAVEVPRAHYLELLADALACRGSWPVGSVAVLAPSTGAPNPLGG